MRRMSAKLVRVSPVNIRMNEFSLDTELELLATEQCSAETISSKLSVFRSVIFEVGPRSLVF